MFNFKKNKNIEFNEITYESFLITLTKLVNILSKAELNAQVQVIVSLIDLLKQRKNEKFVNILNSIDMWGGSGAVWEVHIEDNQNAKKFEMEMINLIDLMEKSNVLGRGIKPIRKLFKENLEVKE